MQFNQPVNLLIVEDESFDVERIRRTLAPFNDRLIIKDIVADGQSAIDLISKDGKGYDVIIMDYQIMGPISGEKLIRKIKAIEPCIQIIVVTKKTINATDFEFANSLIEAGAMWFCTKYPADIKEYIYQPTDLLLSIFNAYENKRLKIERSKSRYQLNQSIAGILNEKKIIGESPVIKDVLKKIEKAAEQDTTVLISGASGTGKELAAINIHYLSRRKYENFMTINAGSIPHELIESELFGFEKGSFTGAVHSKKGLFEVANNGSIFLDEVSELPPSSQVKLLRVLQGGEIDKIGRTDKIKVDVRVIAASNVDLETAVNEKKFREDLFYRLNVMYIHMPALRERVEDIPILVKHFLDKYCIEMHHNYPQISDDAMDILRAYHWPGNVRQLQNVIQRALLTCDEEIKREDLINIIGHDKIRTLSGPEFWFGEKILNWKEMENIFRWKYFSYVKAKTKSESEAARLLGIAPPNFYRMCHKLGIKNSRDKK